MANAIKMTFEARLALIKTVDDLEQQISLARTYVKNLRAKAVKAGLLAEKLAINEQVKAAEQVLRQLRFRSFDIEDAINAGGFNGVLA